MQPFPLPILFTAWTFGSDGGSAVGNCVRKAGELGAKSVAVSLADVVTAEHVRELRAAGLFVVAWGVADATTVARLQELAPDGYMPQSESDPQAAAALAELAAGAGAGLPKALVTTYGGASSPEMVAKFANAGVTTAFVECYAASGYPYNEVARMLWQGTQYGWLASSLVPLLGTYRGELPAAYNNLPASRDFGLYLAEPMTDAQLLAWAQVGPAPTPIPAPPTPAQLNAQIVALCDLWLSTRPTDETSSRLRNIRRIAASYGKAGWIPGAQPDVTAALDANGL